jgi:hypothetical protein
LGHRPVRGTPGGQLRPVVAFLAGAAVAGAIVALVGRAPPAPTPDDERVDHWRERALAAERDVTAARRQLANLTAQLEELAHRFDAISARFAALTAAALPTPAPEAADTPVAEPPAAPPGSPTPEFQAVNDEQWDALVRGTLQSEIERRLGATLPPQRVDRLVGALDRMRDASRSLALENLAPEDPAVHQAELMRNIVMLEADRAFRDELGIGVAEFLRGLDPGQVEEVR